MIFLQMELKAAFTLIFIEALLIFLMLDYLKWSFLFIIPTLSLFWQQVVDILVLTFLLLEVHFLSLSWNGFKQPLISRRERKIHHQYFFVAKRFRTASNFMKREIKSWNADFHSPPKVEVWDSMQKILRRVILVQTFQLLRIISSKIWCKNTEAPRFKPSTLSIRNRGWLML